MYYLFKLLLFAYSNNECHIANTSVATEHLFMQEARTQIIYKEKLFANEKHEANGLFQAVVN